MSPEQIAQVRRFNRLVTQRAGALDTNFLGRARPLGHSRVLYEIGPRGADLRDVRARLGLDSGYLSRIVQTLESDGLVTVVADAGDERVRHARLTRAGRAEVREMNRRSDQAAEHVLAPLSERQRERLTAAMADVQVLLQAAGIVFERVEPDSAEARTCLARYYAELAVRFEGGFDEAGELPTAPDELRPPRGAFLVASVDGAPVACSAVKTFAPRVGYIKRMWVDGAMRGVGLGRRMLQAIEAQARELGFTTVVLETNRALTEAINLYRHAGYTEVAPFNDERYAHHWFRKRLRAGRGMHP